MAILKIKQWIPMIIQTNLKMWLIIYLVHHDMSRSHRSKEKEEKHTLGPLNAASDKRLALFQEEFCKLFAYSVISSGKIPEECWRNSWNLCFTATCAKFSLFTDAHRKSVNSPSSVSLWLLKRCRVKRISKTASPRNSRRCNKKYLVFSGREIIMKD